MGWGALIAKCPEAACSHLGYNTEHMARRLHSGQEGAREELLLSKYVLVPPNPLTFVMVFMSQRTCNYVHLTYSFSFNF